MSALEEPFEYQQPLHPVEMGGQDGLADLSGPELFPNTLAVVKRAKEIYQTARDADTYREWVESYRLDNPVQFELVNEVITAHNEEKPVEEIEATIAELFTGNLASVFATARKANLKNQRVGLRTLSVQANTLARTWFEREYSTPKRARLSPRYPEQILCLDFLLPKLQKVKPTGGRKPAPASKPEVEVPATMVEIETPISARVITSVEEFLEAQDYLRSLFATADMEHTEDTAVQKEFKAVQQRILDFTNRITPERPSLVALPAELEEAPAFFAESLCNGRTDLFFGPAGERPEKRMRREQIAKRLCNDCAVSAQCLNYAQTLRIAYGIWGGWNEEDRGFPTPAQKRAQAAIANELI